MRFLTLPLAATLLVTPSCRDADTSPETAATSPIAANRVALQDKRRLLDLEGGVNYRDLGGYRTEDGRVTRWETVYRAGSPAGLTTGDMAELERRGIRTVCDWRANEERAGEPNPFVAAHSDVEYWTRDYAMDGGDLMQVLSGPEASAARSRAAMIAAYRTMPEEHAESYRQMFSYLAQGRTPLAFNCSAGKDRTGIGAALLLTALRVPRQTILDDYALSDDVVDYRAKMQEQAASNPAYAALARLPWETVAPLVASDPAYLQSALGALEGKYGSVDAFIEGQLGVTPAMLEAIRANLTTTT